MMTTVWFAMMPVTSFAVKLALVLSMRSASMYQRYITQAPGFGAVQYAAGKRQQRAYQRYMRITLKTCTQTARRILLSGDDTDDEELDDEYECAKHMTSRKRRSKKRSQKTKTPRGSANNAKSVEKLLFGGTVIGTYSSKREAAASEGLSSTSLGLASMQHGHLY